ncbi:fecR family protein [Methyloversatilis sp. RAC08]|uniref:FecR family protein n=1 Tax=Methyloversatilis sp. RAC08 TaxID=1842540 RepID=UPI00085639D4|nr:FecR family protein [Methyloversatilis sp. RAC08]AOF81285.1 fecR family protein [Methyloversatilis sp. RAC08]
MSYARHLSTLAAALVMVPLAQAEDPQATPVPTAGRVSYVSGTMYVQTPDNKTRILGRDSSIYNGDVITTEKSTVARIEFGDGSSLALRPRSKVKIDGFAFDEAKPEKDSLLYSLLKGGLRAVTGLIGKRNREGYRASTVTATIGIRGTRFGMLLCDEAEKEDPACIKALEEAKDRKPGEPALVFDVEEGSIEVKNDAGSKTFEVGQAGVVSSKDSAPATLSENPGLDKVLPSSTAARPGPGGLGGSTGLGSDADASCTVQ